jgi:hypothetical protein
MMTGPYREVMYANGAPPPKLVADEQQWLPALRGQPMPQLLREMVQSCFGHNPGRPTAEALAMALRFFVGL